MQTVEMKHSQTGFAFVTELANELSRGKIELPSFPEIAMRVRKVLSDENVTAADVVRVVGVEPMLAARIVAMANSVALGRSDKSISDLRTAVTRVGFNLVRSASIAFAMAQLRAAESLKACRKPLEEHWQRSATVASFAYVVARRHSAVNADTALLAGLLHGIGKLYILARVARHPKLFADTASYQAIESQWHVSIAQALLQNWGISEDIGAAIEHFEDTQRENDGAVDLTDILSVASIVAGMHESPDSLEITLQLHRGAQRMHLDRKALNALVAESNDEVELIRQTLGM